MKITLYSCSLQRNHERDPSPESNPNCQELTVKEKKKEKKIEKADRISWVA